MERQFRMSKCDALKFSHDVRQFRVVAFQKLATRRDVEKQILNRKVGTNRTRNHFLVRHFRTFYLDAHAQFVFCRASAQFHLCHSSNGCQGFATESHRLERKEVVCFLNLRSSVTFEGQSCICFTHSFAVVNDLHAGLTGISHNDLHAIGTCINTIFHQLFYQRRRSLNNFASCNLIGY